MRMDKALYTFKDIGDLTEKGIILFLDERYIAIAGSRVTSAKMHERRGTDIKLNDVFSLSLRNYIRMYHSPQHASKQF